MAKDTYTTLPEKVMEYLESTMETFIWQFDLYEIALHHQKQVLLLSHVVFWAKKAICNVRNSKYTIDCVGVYHFFYTSQITHNFQYTHPYIVNLRKFVFIQ